jgi:hypothetical protein
MIGSDPFGPDGLKDLQSDALKSREEIERRRPDPSDDDYEPETLNEAHWWVQPKWVK